MVKPAERERPYAPPWQFIACGLQTGVWLVTAVVLSRRLSGDASGLATQWSACLVGSVSMAVSALVTDNRSSDTAALLRSPGLVLPDALCLLPGLMLGIALLPAGSGAGLAALLGLFGIALLTRISANPQAVRAGIGLVLSGDGAPMDNGRSASVESADTSASVSHSTPIRPVPTADSPAAVSMHSDLAAGPGHEPETAGLQPRITPAARQWMCRSRDEGYELLEGELRVEFLPGQRVVPVHLPFSPALSATPDFECEGLDDCDVSFRTTACHSYGVRVEVSRSGPTDEAAITTIGWAASSPLAPAVTDNHGQDHTARDDAPTPGTDGSHSGTRPAAPDAECSAA